MYLYVHEFENPKDCNVQEIKDMLFENSVKDFQARNGMKQKNLKVDTTKHGKPFFPRVKNLHFNITHSGRFWVCLFDTENVGVDVEDYSRRNLPQKRFMDITKRFFKPDEQDYVLGSTGTDDGADDAGGTDKLAMEPDEALKNRFFRIWTAKESYMKFTGNGFTEGFKNFSVLDDSLDLYFRNVPVDPQVVLTYCSERDTNLDELINI